MHKKLLLTAAVVSFYSLANAQVEKDSIKIQEVVVTGQFNPQSIKKSLYKVEVIGSEDIKRMAVNNVAEVLNQTLNILIIPEKNSGDSKANILGLGANYTKILVDNIPVIGDTGMGSNIDLTKLSLDNIERIEIVKGSMGVEFGNNAIAGVINIITKKNSKKKWNISGFAQEETVGKEYDWKENGKGRHIQSLTISHNITDKLFATINFNRNDFQGFWGDLQGKNHFEQDGKRGYLWQPKEIINPNLLLRYASAKTQIFYKFDYLSEKINYYNPIVETKFLGAGERTFISKDRDYFTTRMLHHFNIQTEIFKKTKLSSDFSYQKQQRQNQDYIYDIPNRKDISKNEKSTYYEAETFYSRSTISNFLNSKNIDSQIGYEAYYTKGYAGWLTGSYAGNNPQKDILNASVFASSEFNLTENWFLRPGFRVNISDTYHTKPNFSLVIKNKINEQSQFRAIMGSANSNPTFEQLFTYFVDSNHDIRGNEDLKPENSYSGTLFYSLYNKPGSSQKWSIDISSMYLQMQDRIDMTIVNSSPIQYKFVNINTYESWLNSISGKISHKNYGLNAGFSLMGRTLNIENINDSKYRYSFEVNASAYYNLLKTKTLFALYYKGVGKSYTLAEEPSLGVTQYVLSRRNSFSLLDFSIAQKLWKDHITINFGVRNILDVSQVQNLSAGAGTHGTVNAGERLFYGRSYFGKINFNF